MNISIRHLGFVAMATTVGLGIAETAVGTPGVGIVSAEVVARASFTDPVDIKFKLDDGSKQALHVPNAAENVMQRVVIGPLGQTGWHSRLGPAIVLVKSGTLSFYSSESPTCTATDYAAGDAFVDSGQGHVHNGLNLSTDENLELWVTYFDVPPADVFRLNAPDPGNCPPNP